jgi:hypothetical protein
MSRLLNDILEGKDVINGQVLMWETSMSSSSKMPPLKLPKKLQMENCSKEFRKHVAYHDHPVIVGIRTRTVPLNYFSGHLLDINIFILS